MNIKPSPRVWIMIALSLAWAIGAGIHTRNADVERSENFAKFAYNTCRYGKEVNHDTDLSSCDADRAKNLKTWMEGSNANVAMASLAPIPFAWLAGFILLYAARAQIIGFRGVVPWATLTRVKKLFVVFCALASFASMLFGIVMLLNLYVDTKVRVSPSSFVDVIKTGENLVTVEGTWTRTDLTDDTIANPLQTSKIQCSKTENRCTEALASVSEFTLMSEIVEYDIQSWTPDAIVLRRDYPCATELFTIDLNTKAVSGAGHRINENELFCKSTFPSQNQQGAWTYSLSSGFQVYWGLRQKARPVLLRVIQSIFGN
jgi:hypothetical protein